MEDRDAGWTIAAPTDGEVLLDLLKHFYEEEKLTFIEGQTDEGLLHLLDHPDRGTVLVLRSGNISGGYVIATLCFSVEFGGLFALIDELYILPEFRGKGAWRAGFQLIEDWARAIGAKAVRLEVNHHNQKALDLYLDYGFEDNQRTILSKSLEKDLIASGID